MIASTKVLLSSFESFQKSCRNIAAGTSKIELTKSVITSFESESLALAPLSAALTFSFGFACRRAPKRITGSSSKCPKIDSPPTLESPLSAPAVLPDSALAVAVSLFLTLPSLIGCRCLIRSARLLRSTSF